jgi:hypothetical protein
MQYKIDNRNRIICRYRLSILSGVAVVLSLNCTCHEFYKRGVNWMRNSLLLAGLLLAQASFGDAISDFSTDADGWTTFGNGGAPVVYSSTGGNPGGYIRIDDLTSDWGYLQAPAKFLAPAPYGGQLSFDLKIFNSNPTQYPNIYNVRVGLTGGGLTLINELTLPTSSFQNYVFDLTETSGWRIFSDLSQNYNAANPMPTQAQMMQVLANLTGVFIAADYSDAYSQSDGTIDQTAIDNVFIGVSAIPEPAVNALLLLGAIALVVRRFPRRAGCRS